MTAEDSDTPFGRVKTEATDQASRLADSVIDSAARQGDELRAQLATRVEDLAANLRRAGSTGRPNSTTAEMFDRAADTVTDLADSLGSGDPRQMIEDVREFARRQPGAFLGLSALAGFAAARFLRAGTPSPSGATRSAPGDPLAGSPVPPPSGPAADTSNPFDRGHHA